MNDDAQAPSDEAARTAVARILRPLARVMIAHHLRLADAVAVLKAALVAAARQIHAEAAPETRTLTDSRLSLMTGVHRKDLRALRIEGDRVLRPARSTAATLIGRWMGDPDYTDAAGAPLPLPRRAEAGPSFEALAASVSTDIHPRTLLDTLQALGAVEERPGPPPRLHLSTDALTPRDDGALDFFARNLADHAAAAAHNVTAPEDAPRFLERAVFYNRLHPDSVARLDAMAREGALDLLRRLNAEALRAQRSDARAPDTATERFRFGTYFFTETETRGPDDRRGGEPDP